MKVAFSTDSNYIIPATVAITSFLENNGGSEIDLFLLYIEDTLQEQDLIGLKKVVESYQAHFCPLPVKREMLQDMPILRHGLSTYLRIFLPQILIDVDKILYLDVDLIVERNLHDLFHIDMRRYQLAAVADLKTIYDGSTEYLDKIGYKKTTPYFCAGILVMNLSILRKIDLVGLTIRYLSVYGDKISHSDQDILNVVCDKILYLPPKYNCIEGLFNRKCREIWSDEQIKEAIQRPCIVHYLGPSKPWHFLCTNFFRNRWFKYLDKTTICNKTELFGEEINLKCKFLLTLKNVEFFIKRIKVAGPLRYMYLLGK